MAIKLKHLESHLQEVAVFEEPNVWLEQYPTTPHLAASMLYTMHNTFDDVRGKVIADLGIGCGILTIASAIMGSGYNIGFDIDTGALKMARQNLTDFEVACDLVQIDIASLLPESERTALLSDDHTADDDDNDVKSNGRARTGNSGKARNAKLRGGARAGRARGRGRAARGAAGRGGKKNGQRSGRTGAAAARTAKHISDDDQEDDATDDSGDAKSDASDDTDNDDNSGDNDAGDQKKASKSKSSSTTSAADKKTIATDVSDLKSSHVHRDLTAALARLSLTNSSTDVSIANGSSSNNTSTGSVSSVSGVSVISGVGLHRIVDIVITNPPFGTRRAGIDMVFVRVGLQLARTAVYSLHKTSTREYIAKQAASWGVEARVVAQLKFEIPAMYSFHKQSSVDVDVDFWRFAHKPSITTSTSSTTTRHHDDDDDDDDDDDA